jgi:hypothetical protein
VDNDFSWTLLLCFMSTFLFPFNVHENSPKSVHEISPKSVHEMSPKSVHEMSPKQCPREVTQNVHEMSPKKCPRNVTQKCPRNVTQKCPRNVTPFVHEKSPFMSTRCLPPIFLIQITSNYLWASEVFKNQRFKNHLFSSKYPKLKT